MAGIDSNTVLMLHNNGTDGSTTFTDDSASAHSVTANGNAQIDTAQSKFGGASGLFDNNNSTRLTIADSDDFNFGSGDFTIDFWVRFDSTAGTQALVTQWGGGGSNGSIYIVKLSSGTLSFFYSSDGASETQLDSTFSSFSTSTWYHVAIVRDGTTMRYFVDGVASGTGSIGTTSINNSTRPFNISTYADGTGQPFRGNIDEIRVSKGVARWTSGFTPPTSEYSAPSSVDENETVEISDAIEMQLTTDLGSEGIEVSDSAIVKLAKSIADSDEVEIGDSIEISAGVSGNEEITIADSIEVNIPVEHIIDTDGITISDSIEVSIDVSAVDATRIISVNPLVFVSDTDPLQVTKVDTTDPENPTWIVYVINGTGETVRNGKDIVYNATEDALYVATAEGKILKLDFSDLDTREEIDLIDTDDLTDIEVHEDFQRVIAASDQVDGEVIVLDTFEMGKLLTDIRTVVNIKQGFLTQVDTIFAKSLLTDIRTVSNINSFFKTDVRVLSFDYSDLACNVVGRPDVVVRIDGTITDDVMQEATNIRHMADEESQLSFVLGRRHDELDYQFDGTFSQITNQNAVTVHINGVLEFSGKISVLECVSETETVIVTAKANEVWNSNKRTTSVPMSSLNAKLHPYDVLIHSPQINNPYIDPDDDNPEKFKGIKADLGLSTRQTVARYRTVLDNPVGAFYSQIPIGGFSLGSTALDIMEGNFKPKQNWTYFWGSITAENFSTGNTNQAFYVGTSLSGYSSETWELLQVKYRYQRIYDDYLNRAYNYTVSAPGYTVQVPLDEADLKELPEDTPNRLKVRTEYRIGEAPFQEVSIRNGVFSPKWRWEDRTGGLYDVLDAKYDFRPYVVQVANLEYEKLKNINGTILPDTSANIEMMIDAYHFYDIQLLTRMNINNTTTSGIFSNSNGFPISVKAIDINTATMRVTLTCDNKFSFGELQEIDDTYPDEEDFIENPVSKFLLQKSDPNREESVS